MNSLDFAKKKMSVTYFVFDDRDLFVGYFTLAHKNTTIPAGAMSKTNQRKLARYGKLDEATGCYDVSAFLIAQLGKNFAVDDGFSISGDILMDKVFDVLYEVQRLIGGGVVFLECEESPELLAFYCNDHNRFIVYGDRLSASEEKKYLQLLCIF